MSDDNARKQGDDGQDDDIGFDLTPVTAPSPDNGGQSDKTPSSEVTPVKEVKPDGEKPGAAKPTNADNKEKRITEKKTRISQEDWQEMVDSNQNLTKEVQQLRTDNERARFENKNPVVTNEKYAKKWEELCTLKSDPNHKYHKLDFSDLKQLMLNNEGAEEVEDAMKETEKKPLTPPHFTAGTKPKTPGNVDPETYDWLKSRGYSDEEIAQSDKLTLS